MTEDEITTALAELPGWERQGDKIVKTFKHKNFRRALAFVVEIGVLAEKANHHPDISIHGWNQVTLSLTTHSAGGLTDKDFQLARRIEELSG
ncbi:hypothetical protein TH66_00410 [Carbonactinospora thermoautotrophica]|uniref:Putative pterin-4-alpha-carbinolamine dehydratase n=1 Tax=Carbonactinospora thermoautotrophica TaxID=1469144 RepID=A0A132N6Q5_9ACTN|nr:4a-hydroxytetrahydrobiopterin dehydratase [Carbonactinospora thermoautotrophica]KWX05841.1 hypothetical protein TH66_00410 [Carbonactinospora thermoautotrophica]KWX08989.1 hypothetical protein TR74_12320 [Carbonactinospora thermoautotrophica]